MTAPDKATMAEIEALGYQVVEGWLRETRGITFPEGAIDDLNYRVGAAIAIQLEAEQGWQKIETAPKDEMFIWAAPKGNGKWGLGLAYRNVSGGWSDAYASDAPERATHWHPLPAPPPTKEQKPTPHLNTHLDTPHNPCHITHRRPRADHNRRGNHDQH